MICNCFASMMLSSSNLGGLMQVFPRGSPLVADVSRAILNVTQGDKLETLEDAWFKRSNCAESDTSFSSNSLGLDSFWALFLLAGVASMSALTIFATTFLCQHRHIWLHCDPNTSVCRRMEILLRIFDQRDQSSHTFKKTGLQNKTHSEISPSGQLGMLTTDYSDSNPNGDSPQDTEMTMMHNISSPTSSTLEVGHASNS